MLPTTTKHNMEVAIKKVNSWIQLNDPTKVLILCHLELEQLPPIPITCQELMCYQNKLTSLPDLPNCRKLFCSHNQLTSLPKLSPYCLHIDCSYNNLTSIPEDLHYCLALTCDYNKLTSLPKLPNCVQINCSNNYLVSLPQLNNCHSLECSNNELTYLPQLKKCTWCVYANNKYLYINEKQIKQFYPYYPLHYFTTPNYNKHAQIIQRNYKKYLRKKYRELIDNFLFMGPSKIVSLYTI